MNEQYTCPINTKHTTTNPDIEIIGGVSVLLYWCNADADLYTNV